MKLTRGTDPLRCFDELVVELLGPFFIETLGQWSTWIFYGASGVIPFFQASSSSSCRLRIPGGVGVSSSGKYIG